jgi:hypothetical protein
MPVLPKPMFNWLKQFGRTHYVGMMESELVRLRAENRALTNSLLGTAGFPPVDFPQEVTKPVALSRLRKRSWLQVQARRESDAARDIETNRDERVYGPVSHS